MTVAIEPCPPAAAQKSVAIRGGEVLALPFLALLIWGTAVIAMALISIFLVLPRGPSVQADIHVFLYDLVTNVFAAETVMASYYLIFLSLLRRSYRRRGENLLTNSTSVDWRWIFLAALSGVVFALIVLHLTTDEEVSIPLTYDQLAVSLLGGAVLAPFVEEVYFRGLFLKWLRQRWSIVSSVLINGVIFALVHGFPIRYPGFEAWIVTAIVALMGATYAVWTVRTGSLWPPIAAHSAYNAVLIAGPPT